VYHVIELLRCMVTYLCDVTIILHYDCVSFTILGGNLVFLPQPSDPPRFISLQL
jgi:hypothetical protein